MLTYLLLVFAIMLLATGQLLQKIGAQKIPGCPSVFSFLAHALAVREFQLAIVALSLGTLCWLFVLLNMEVSKAFPLLSTSFIIVLLLSRKVLNEKISLLRWLGVAFITGGTILLAIT